MSDIYKIGVMLQVSTNGIPVLGALAHSLLNVGKAAQTAQKHMGALQVAAKGALGVMAGAGTLRVMAHLIKDHHELVHQQNLLRRAGVDNQKIAEATARAWQTTRDVQGTRVEENLKMFGELRSQVSSDDQALMLLPSVARMGTLMQNETGKAPDHMAQTVMRVLEMRGQIFGPDHHTMDPAKVEREMGLMYKAMATSHGLITPQTFLQFQQQAGPAGMAMTPEAYYGLMPTAMQTMGGHRAGTAITSLFSQFVGGVMTQRSATELEKLGLLDKSKVHVRRGGQVTTDAGAIAGFDPSNPFSFFAGSNSAFQRAVKAHGGNAGAALEGVLDPQMVQAMYRSLGRETTRRIIAEFVQLAPTFERDFNLRQKTMTPEAAAAEAAHDPDMAITKFTSAWNNLQEALATPLVDKAVEVLGKFTDVLNRLAQWAAANPDTVEKLGVMFAALAGLATVGGALAVAAAAVSVLAGPAGLVAVAAGLVALGDSLKHGDSPIAQELAKYLPQEKDIIPAFFEFGKRVVWHLADATLRVGTEIGHALRASFDEHIAKPVVDWASTGLSAAASAVTSGLSHITQAIMSWIAGIPGAIAGAIGLRPAAPGTENHPNGVPGTGPLFGPQPPGDPSQAPGLLHRGSFVPPPANNNHVTLIHYTVLDSKVVAKGVSSLMARSGSGPSGGATGFDGRAGYVGGMQMGAA